MGEDAWESLTSGAEQVWENVTAILQESKDAFLEGLQDDK